MSSHAEDVLFSSLSDVDSVEFLAKEGLSSTLDIIPTEEMRPVVEWAIDYFMADRKRAPSRQAILDTWGQVLEDAEIELLSEDEEQDSVEWALERLRSQSVEYQSQVFLKDFATSMSKASPIEKVETLATQANALYAMSLAMQPSTQSATLDTMHERWDAFLTRLEHDHTHEGMTFGIPAVDMHTYGIHPGEVAVLAAGPKTGKSLFMLDVAYHEVKQGRRTVLFTLENSVDMTLDRLATRVAQANARDFQRGQSTPEDVAKIRAWLDDMPEDLLHVIMPGPDQRTIAAMHRQAVMLGAESLLIDQLTFVEHPDPGRKARHEIIRDMMHELKERCSTGVDRLPALIAHQINREGMKAAEKTGRLEMYHMAEGSEIERTADWVFGLYRSETDVLCGQAKLQTMAARRADLERWVMDWDVNKGTHGNATIDTGEE